MRKTLPLVSYVQVCVPLLQVFSSSFALVGSVSFTDAPYLLFVLFMHWYI
jgi:hypothetical protein